MAPSPTPAAPRKSGRLRPVLVSIVLIWVTAASAQAGIETGFEDVGDKQLFADEVAWLRLEGITHGCNPPANTNYCPDQPVTRGQMAAFLARALALAPTTTDYFTDDNTSEFETAINQIAATGITKGCNPPANTNYCPDQPVTRGQMAAFLWRASGAPATPPAARVVAAGDIAQCGFDAHEATADLLDVLFTSTNGVVAALGDTAYPAGSADSFLQCYDPGWGRHGFRTRPAVGNHEYLTSGAAGYFDYFGAAAGDPSQGWYSYELGSWSVVVLNSNCDEIGGCDAGSEQELWLRDTLAASRQCTMVYMHHPRFSSGTHGDDAELADLWAAMEEYGVDLALAGHDHDYERFAPLTATGALAGADGIQSFVVGTGGTWLRPMEQPRPGSEVAIDDAHGVLVLDLSPDSYEWSFVDTSRAGLDSGSRSCS